MAITGVNNVSVLESSYLGENYSPASRRWGNQDSPISRTSFIRKMWRDLEGESRFRENERQQTGGMVNGSNGSLCSCSSGGAEGENVSVTTSEVENECPRDQNQMGLRNGQEDDGNMCLQRLPAFGVAEKQRVRQVFREWGSKSCNGRALNVSHKNNCPRAQWICENECKRVRTVRQWIELNSQQAETGHSGIEEQATEIGSQIEQGRNGLGVAHTRVGDRRSICKLYGRQALLDLLTRFERERKCELRSLIENRPVTNFAHRNRLQSLLRGRFLWNQRFVQDKKSSSIAASELGLLRQTHSVSDLRKGFLSKLDNYEPIPDGSQSDTSSENDMKYNEENFQELPVDIVNEYNTPNIRSNISETHKAEWETDTCISPREYSAPAEERNERVLEDEERKQQPPTEFIGTMDQESSMERSQEPEVREASDHDDRSETNTEDSLSWHGSAEEWQEPVTEDNVSEWHHLTNTESDGGLDANSIEHEHEWYQETAVSDYQESHDGWYDNTLEEDTTTDTWFAPQVVRRNAFYTSDDDDNNNGNRLELRELMSRGRVSSLLQSDFRVRLDQLIQSYVERQDQAYESDDEWMLEREQQDQNQQSVDGNDDATETVEEPEGAHSSPPATPQTRQDDTEWEMINGLRIDMVSLQERMNNMQTMLETCMNVQLELQRSVQQEVSLALNRTSTSDDESKWNAGKEEACPLCCDSSFDSSPNRCGPVYVCSKCASKINWSKLKESVRHP